MAEGQPSSIYQILDQFRWHWRSWDELKTMSWFTRVSYVNFFMFIFFVGFAIWQARNKTQQAQQAGPNKSWLPAPEFPEVVSLPDFSWEKEEPLKFRTFRPKYHLTMALQKLEPTELITMDKTYLQRVQYRSNILKTHHDIAITINDDKRANLPVRELYTWLMSTYLPKRYPTMFKLHYASFETGDTYMLENLVTKAIHPAKADKNTKTVHLLESLCKTVDEDFLFLVPEATEEDKEDDAKYVLEACLCIGPSGWNPQEKIGKRLADIHGPVPGYRKILEGSMDRYFAKVQAGEYVKRSNWMVTTTPELFAFQSGSNHAREGDKVEELKEIDPENTFLRCERQTLHRLPKSEAMVFAFKTYMYSMKDIKEEGLGNELAEAIDGMKQGNVPSMFFYKRGSAWGEAVKSYLRS